MAKMRKKQLPLDLNTAFKRCDRRPRSVRIYYLEDFIRLTTWLYNRDETVIFRGQRCDWPLVPAVGRDFKKQWFYKEPEVIEEFKREALPHLRFMPSNDWQWLAVAQHNRLPTRLLDWSRNPLVALWFAVSEPAQDGKPGIVWAHDYEPSEAIYTTTNAGGEGIKLGSPFSIDKTSVYLPEHVFPYIQAQSGVFTIHHRRAEDNQFVPFEVWPRSPSGVSASEDEMYEDEMYEDEMNLHLVKIKISAHSFPTIRHQLFRLGISPASLFPGLSGLVDRIKYENEYLEDEKPRRRPGAPLAGCRGRRGTGSIARPAARL